MRRVLVYFEYKAVHWVTRGSNHGCTVLPPLEEGLRAYAENQAQLLRDMAKRFEGKWAVLRGGQLTIEDYCTHRSIGGRRLTLKAIVTVMDWWGTRWLVKMRVPRTPRTQMRSSLTELVISLFDI